jgi:hypothetical protein
VDLPQSVRQSLRSQLPPLGGVVVGAQGEGAQGLLEDTARKLEEETGRALRGLFGKEPEKEQATEP